MKKPSWLSSSCWLVIHTFVSLPDEELLPIRCILCVLVRATIMRVNGIIRELDFIVTKRESESTMRATKRPVWAAFRTCDEWWKGWQRQVKAKRDLQQQQRRFVPLIVGPFRSETIFESDCHTPFEISNQIIITVTAAPTDKMPRTLSWYVCVPKVKVPSQPDTHCY